MQPFPTFCDQLLELTWTRIDVCNKPWTWTLVAAWGHNEDLSLLTSVKAFGTP